MKNINETREALKKALVKAGTENALSEVRYHIKAALNKLEHVESKRNRREIHLEKRLEKKKIPNVVTDYDPLLTLQAIDEEIAKTKSFLEDIQRKRSAEDEEEDDGFQTIFG